MSACPVFRQSANVNIDECDRCGCPLLTHSSLPSEIESMPAAHPLPTPRTDEACKENGAPTSLVYADFARQLEREAAELRAQLAEVKEALAGDDYASLPSDYPLVRMAHTIRADHDKFRNQVIDTCTRAETAERQRDEALKDAERYLDGFTVLLAYAYQMGFFTGDDSPRIRAWLEACPQRPGVTVGTAIDAAIDAAKEKSHG